jgi:ubiquinone biosynthesis UbiH/UbiF/VisC/COQ6 family hydroxylase
VRALPDLAVALVGNAPEPAATDGFDPRTYALSPGNVGFLRRLGVWDPVAARAAPVHAMRIYGDDARAALEFSAYEAGVPELAWIVEDASLQRALWDGLQASARRCEAVAFAGREATVTFEDGTSIAAQLVVGADGAQSFVRTSAGIEARERDFEQAAVVANFRCEKPHANTAYQWFQGGPVLALLPLPGDQVSMVWSLPAPEAARMAALASAGLAEEVTRASRRVLGELAPASPVRAFPLRHLSARRLVGPRVALVGDAGHVVHPLAGQGLNLGLQDVRVLAEILTSREPGRDPGDYRLLRRYERRRAEPILAMDAAISGLFALYGAQSRTIGRLRNAGLNLTDRLPVLKNLLMRQAMS